MICWIVTQLLRNHHITVPELIMPSDDPLNWQNQSETTTSEYPLSCVGCEMDKKMQQLQTTVQEETQNNNSHTPARTQLK